MRLRFHDEVTLGELGQAGVLGQSGPAFSNLQPCPRCGGTEIFPEFGDEPYGLYCRSCQWGGPRASEADGDPDQAIAAWNDEARKVALAREMGLKLNLVQPVEVDGD